MVIEHPADDALTAAVTSSWGEADSASRRRREGGPQEEGNELADLRHVMERWQRLPVSERQTEGHLCRLGLELARRLFVDKIDRLLAMKSSWPTQPPTPLAMRPGDCDGKEAAVGMVDDGATIIMSAADARVWGARGAELSEHDMLRLFLYATARCARRLGAAAAARSGRLLHPARRARVWLIVS